MLAWADTLAEITFAILLLLDVRVQAVSLLSGLLLLLFGMPWPLPRA